MTFGAPQYLWALAALPVLVGFVWWMSARRRSSVLRIGDPALIERLSASVNRGARLRRAVLWFIGAGLVITALARPQWGSDVEVVEHRGVQVMVALDISRSMLAQDVKPSRLDRAKLEISDLMSRLTGDEIGIVLFSGASFIQFPITFDYATARTYLSHAHPDAITRQGTVIAEAIETAMTGFSDQRTGQKVIVVMTDGENHEGDPVARDPVEEARWAASKGAVVYTIGFGSVQGEPLPEYDESGALAGFREDAQGDVVISRLDEDTLVRVAQAGGGRYFRAADPDAISDLAAEIQSFEDETLESEFSRTKIERFQIFLLAGVLALAAAEVMTDRFSIRVGRRRAVPREVDGNA